MPRAIQLEPGQPGPDWRRWCGGWLYDPMVRVDGRLIKTSTLHKRQLRERRNAQLLRESEQRWGLGLSREKDASVEQTNIREDQAPGSDSNSAIDVECNGRTSSDQPQAPQQAQTSIDDTAERLVDQSNPSLTTATSTTTTKASLHHSALNALLTKELIHRARQRQHPKTLCPSEVARKINLSFPTVLLADPEPESSSTQSAHDSRSRNIAVGNDEQAGHDGHADVLDVLKSWRDLMPLLRQFCVELHNKPDADSETGRGKENMIEILQKGEVLPRPILLENIRGPIRARLRRRAEA
ncbi:uncharacterized protein AB675_7511 [Cyphellophora attinorum]|uniref:Uncharacterized protein n=1 Tax=Cyphellophora attinorum TaxID=1664694 RepID=A0A0N0NMI2_9EURO|nr:uncharacterized protein AB675_7511 [Phialophora attinorum]KPI40491.1 hypothetical protein AB675_7511 [Phialophora attinorum]